MKCVVTGGSGFIGRHLVKFLTQKNVKIFEVKNLDEDLESIETVDHIFHLAAKTSIPESWESPEEYLQVNTLGTLKMLQLAKKMGCSLTYLSTYPPSEVSPHFYSLSKDFGEQLCTFYAHHFQIPLTILRLANVYGPGQKESFLIPFVLSQVLDPSIPVVRVKDLTPFRDFIYIDDVVEALDRSVPQANKMEVFHLGTGKYTSVEEVIQMSLRLARISKPYRGLQETRQGEVTQPQMNGENGLFRFEWRANVSLEEGLQRMIHAQLNQ